MHIELTGQSRSDIWEMQTDAGFNAKDRRLLKAMGIDPRTPSEALCDQLALRCTPDAARDEALRAILAERKDRMIGVIDRELLDDIGISALPLAAMASITGSSITIEADGCEINAELYSPYPGMETLSVSIEIDHDVRWNGAHGEYMMSVPAMAETLALALQVEDEEQRIPLAQIVSHPILDRHSIQTGGIVPSGLTWKVVCMEEPRMEILISKAARGR